MIYFPSSVAYSHFDFLYGFLLQSRAPLLGLAKSIYYNLRDLFSVNEVRSVQKYQRPISSQYVYGPAFFFTQKKVLRKNPQYPGTPYLHVACAQVWVRVNFVFMTESRKINEKISFTLKLFFQECKSKLD